MRPASIGDELLQPLLSVDQRRRAEILPIEIEQIEHIVAEAVDPPLGEIALQQGKVRGAAFVLDDQFAIQ